jgi:type IV secretory pathway protease TraF
VSASDRQKVFLLAIAAAVVFIIVGILYLTSHSIPSGFHWKHAVLSFALAAGALIVANFNRPGAGVAAAKR